VEKTLRKQRDGQATKQLVLAAAQDLFAKTGFSGTALADISRETGISDGLILHHFQSKKQLYRQVLESLAEQYAESLRQARETASSSDEIMQYTLEAAFSFWKHDSAYQRISLWAYLEGQAEFADKEAALTAGLVQEVENLQSQGVLDDRFAPMVFLTMIIGPMHFWLRYREQFKSSLNLSETSDELDQLFLGQLIQMIKEMAHNPSASQNKD
jgi:AcrR family transcriptional regulator